MSLDGPDLTPLVIRGEVTERPGEECPVAPQPRRRIARIRHNSGQPIQADGTQSRWASYMRALGPGLALGQG